MLPQWFNQLGRGCLYPTYPLRYQKRWLLALGPCLCDVRDAMCLNLLTLLMMAASAPTKRVKGSEREKDRERREWETQGRDSNIWLMFTSFHWPRLCWGPPPAEIVAENLMYNFYSLHSKGRKGEGDWIRYWVNQPMVSASPHSDVSCPQRVGNISGKMKRTQIKAYQIERESPQYDCGKASTTWIKGSAKWIIFKEEQIW